MKHRVPHPHPAFAAHRPTHCSQHATSSTTTPARIVPSAHRLRVGDRAAVERDCPVVHRDHAAILNTAEQHPRQPPSTPPPAPPRPRASAPTRIAARRCAHKPRSRISPRHRTARRPSPCGSHRRHRRRRLRTAHEGNAPHARRLEGTAGRPHRAQHATRNVRRATCDVDHAKYDDQWM